jgi:phage tail sheath protein FI
VTSFLAELARQGALYDYVVSCSLGTTMTVEDVLNGILNLSIMFTPTETAKFLDLTFQLSTSPGT